MGPQAAGSRDRGLGHLNPSVGETFVIVNPGQGVNKTFNGFWNFLYGMPPDCTDNTCPANQKTIPAARSYDGLEFRVTKAESNHWMGMFSYTWSNFRGNYTGLTSSDLGDGGGGRNAPNNSRAFDEPYFQWNAIGRSSSGLLPTDRPNALKGYVYYQLPWLRKFTTDFGIFQTAYSGTPLTSELDVGYSYAGQPAFPTDIVDRGKWIDVTQDPTHRSHHHQRALYQAYADVHRHRLQPQAGSKAGRGEVPRLRCNLHQRSQPT